jgi:hypothetical protein
MAEQEEKPARVGRVIQQATVLFAEAEITAVLAEDGYVYGALTHLCRALGLDGESQRTRILEQAALAKGLRQFPLSQRQQLITTWCLRADLIPYWLAIVPTSRMKPEKKARIDFYQDQVADVLGRLFGAMPPSTETSLTAQNLVFAEGLAVARMALDEAQSASRKAEETSDEVKALQIAYEARIAALEARLMPREVLSEEEVLNEEQAEHISDLVKQAAQALAKKLGGGGNFFGTIYGQLYRTFNVTSYKLLTQAQYPKVVAWLEKHIKTYEQ